jgi:hypothetical protein
MDVDYRLEREYLGKAQESCWKCTPLGKVTGYNLLDYLTYRWMTRRSLLSRWLSSPITESPMIVGLNIL